MLMKNSTCMDQSLAVLYYWNIFPSQAFRWLGLYIEPNHYQMILIKNSTCGTDSVLFVLPLTVTVDILSTGCLLHYNNVDEKLNLYGPDSGWLILLEYLPLPGIQMFGVVCGT